MGLFGKKSAGYRQDTSGLYGLSDLVKEPAQLATPGAQQEVFFVAQPQGGSPYEQRANAEYEFANAHPDYRVLDVQHGLSPDNDRGILIVAERIAE